MALKMIEKFKSLTEIKEKHTNNPCLSRNPRNLFNKAQDNNIDLDS